MATWETGDVSAELRGAAYQGVFAEHSMTITAEAQTQDPTYTSGGLGFDPNALAGP